LKRGFQQRLLEEKARQESELGRELTLEEQNRLKDEALAQWFRETAQQVAESNQSPAD
jgi:hypothetical protein